MSIAKLSGIARFLAVVVAAGAIPAAAFMIVYRHGIDFPFLDELDLTPLMLSAHAGHVPWEDAWRPHNGHRLFFPTLFVVGLAQVGGWSQLREMLLSLALLTVQLAILWRLIATTLPRVIAPYALLTVSLLSFSFVQWENLFIGFQLAWFLLNFSAIFAIFILTRPTLAFRDVALAFAATTVAGLSATFGLCMFPVGLLVLMLRGRSARSFAVSWTICSVLVVAVFLNGYQANPMMSGQAAPTLLDRLQYVLAYYGSPLGSWNGVALSEALGAFALLTVGVGSIRVADLFRSSGERLHNYLPWLALCTFAILCGILTAYGRVGLGIVQATASRYTLIGTDLWVGLLALLSLLTADALASRLIPKRWSLPAVGLALYGLAVLLERADLGGYRTACAFTDKIARGVVAIREHSEPSDEELELLYPNPTMVRIYLAELSSIGDPRVGPANGDGTR